MPACCAMRFRCAISGSLTPTTALPGYLCRHNRSKSQKPAPLPFQQAPTSQSLTTVRRIPTPRSTPHSLPASTPRASDSYRSLHGALSIARAASGESVDTPIHASVDPTFGRFVALVVPPAEPGTFAAFFASLLLALSLTTGAQEDFRSRYLAEAVAVGAKAHGFVSVEEGLVCVAGWARLIEL
jgi:hypothetical protein